MFFCTTLFLVRRIILMVEMLQATLMNLVKINFCEELVKMLNG
jgi:hypothetical protein